MNEKDIIEKPTVLIANCPACLLAIVVKKTENDTRIECPLCAVKFQRKQLRFFRIKDSNRQIVEAIEMNSQAVATGNKNLSDLVQEVKEIKIEMQALRRNSGYLKNIAETLQRGGVS